ncbi:MAG TPA: hypothetical protein VGL81_22640 [Polyangiaceae bacterium]|jgi:uncharacterized protein (TIGR03382 family)
MLPSLLGTGGLLLVGILLFGSNSSGTEIGLSATATALAVAGLVLVHRREDDFEPRP